MKNILLILCTVILVLFVGTLSAKALPKNFVPQEYTVVKASHILVPTEKEAQTIKVMLEEGEDFAMLARQYSQCPSKTMGGDLGYFKRNQMVKEFENVAFSLPVGTVSEPVKTQFGWHLIKVTDKR